MNELDKMESIKKNLEKSKQDKAVLLGKKESAMDELADLGYKSTAEAKKAIKRKDAELYSMEEEFKGLVEKFKEEYPNLVE